MLLVYYGCECSILRCCLAVFISFVRSLNVSVTWFTSFCYACMCERRLVTFGVSVLFLFVRFLCDQYIIEGVCIRVRYRVFYLCEDHVSRNFSAFVSSWSKVSPTRLPKDDFQGHRGLIDDSNVVVNGIRSWAVVWRFRVWPNFMEPKYFESRVVINLNQ